MVTARSYPVYAFAGSAVAFVWFYRLLRLLVYVVWFTFCTFYAVGYSRLLRLRCVCAHVCVDSRFVVDAFADSHVLHGTFWFPVSGCLVVGCVLRLDSGCRLVWFCVVPRVYVGWFTHARHVPLRLRYTTHWFTLAHHCAHAFAVGYTLLRWLHCAAVYHVVWLRFAAHSFARFTRGCQLHAFAALRLDWLLCAILRCIVFYRCWFHFLFCWLRWLRWLLPVCGVVVTRLPERSLLRSRLRFARCLPLRLFCWITFRFAPFYRYVWLPRLPFIPGVTFATFTHAVARFPFTFTVTGTLHPFVDCVYICYRLIVATHVYPYAPLPLHVLHTFCDFALFFVLFYPVTHVCGYWLRVYVVTLRLFCCYSWLLHLILRCCWLRCY